MSFNVKVISTLNDKNAHEFSMFCDLCVTLMVRFRLKSFSCFQEVPLAFAFPIWYWIRLNRWIQWIRLEPVKHDSRLLKDFLCLPLTIESSVMMVGWWSSFFVLNFDFLLPTNEVWEKVMFSEASIILFTGLGSLPPDREPLDRDAQYWYLVAATKVSGTHYTGMHTCWCKFFWILWGVKPAVTPTPLV